MVSLSRLVRQSSLTDDDMKRREVRTLVDEYRSFANDIDFGAVRTPTRLNQLTRLMRREDSSKTETPKNLIIFIRCLLYTSPSPRDLSTSRMPSSA